MSLHWSEGPLPDEPGARIIADSIAPTGHRITTFEMVMHRFVLAELNTHTLFSRNSESSRAVPYKVKRARLLANPALPVVWPAEKPGMQGGESLSSEDIEEAMDLWLGAMHTSVSVADELTHFWDEETFGVEPTDNVWATVDPLHKSLANRLLEPWMWHTATVTAVDWDGFFFQRSLNHTPEAQPEIAAMATIVEDLYKAATPNALSVGEWHLPYVRPEEYNEFELLDLLKLAVARCARTSYLTHGGLREVDLDFKLYNRLLAGNPVHASPFQHIATPAAWNEAHIDVDPADYGLTGPVKHFDVPIVGNARGYLQLRHIEIGF